MAKSVINLSEPFFLKVLSLVNQPATNPEQLPQLQRQLSGDLQAIEQKVASGNASVSPAEWQSLKKVLVYWADEVLTAHIPDWEDYVLEQEYFGERNRAWKFYVEAEQCIPTGSPSAAELFYLAVALGFNGDIEGAFKYELNQDLPGGKADPMEARKFWASQLQRSIRPESSGDLQGEPLEGHVEPLGGRRTLKTATAAFAISLLALVTVVGWWMLNPR
jgi:type VI protein secretion system component VasF